MSLKIDPNLTDMHVWSPDCVVFSSQGERREEGQLEMSETVTMSVSRQLSQAATITRLQSIRPLSTFRNLYKINVKETLLCL